MARIEHSVVINRPIEEVFTFMADIEKLPQWSAERNLWATLLLSGARPCGMVYPAIRVASILGQSNRSSVICQI